MQVKELSMKEIREWIDEGNAYLISIEDLELYYENMKRRKEYNKEFITLLYAITEFA